MNSHNISIFRLKYRTKAVMSLIVQERSLLEKKGVEVVEGLAVRRSVLTVRIPMTRMKTGKQPQRRNEEPQLRRAKVLRLLKQKLQKVA